MIHILDDEQEFRSLCLTAWHENTTFWSQTRNINKDIRDYLLNSIIAFQPQGGISIADIGCGNGWLLQELIQQKILIKYTGIDFNKFFVANLTTEHPRANFISIDFSVPVSDPAIMNQDILVCCLSFIEMPNLHIPIRNASKMLRNGGMLIIITLDPFFEIIRLNSAYDTLENDLRIFRETDLPCYYRKEIIINGLPSNKYYFGVLHKNDYFQKDLIENKFNLINSNYLNKRGGLSPLYLAYTYQKYE